MSRPRLRLEQIDHVVPLRCGFDPDGNLLDLNGPIDAHVRAGN